MKKICKEISLSLDNIKYDNGDLGDIGNEIGYIIGKYINKTKNGFELDDFINGLKHGISIRTNTH